MLNFLGIFFLCVLTSCCVAYNLYLAIQPEEVFEKWQKALGKLYAKGWYNLEKFLGGCFKCFSHFIAILSFIAYVIINEHFLDLHYRWWYIALYIIFVPTCITFSILMKGIIEKLNK